MNAYSMLRTESLLKMEASFVAILRDGVAEKEGYSRSVTEKNLATIRAVLVSRV